MTFVLAVCIEMEKSVIDTKSRNCKNAFLKIYKADLFIHFLENVNINFTITKNDVIEQN